MTAEAETLGIADGGTFAGVVRLDASAARVRGLSLGLVLGCLAVLALLELVSGGSVQTGALPHRSRGQTARTMPPGLVPAVSASAGASERRFWPVRRGGSLLSSGGGVDSMFAASGVAIHVAEGTLGLSLAGEGRGGRLHPVAAVAPSASANRILYRHRWIRELYANGPFGLEQGFVVSRRPLGHSGPLALLLRVRGSLVPEQVGEQVLFRAPGGAVAASYGRLSAIDATGRRLPVSMRVGHGVLQLRVGDASAHYPLRIDPFIQQGAKLTGGGEAGSGEFGTSVALSADGNTALVGAPGDSGGVGAAWVFTRSGSTWTQQGEKLTGASESGAGRFGTSVALSGDGDTALIGGARDAEGVGAAWVFTRSGSFWAQQGEKLTGAGESGPGAFGQSVALSSDGSTALIGGPMDNPIAQAAIGAAWAFTRSGGSWTQQGDKLTGAGEIGPARFGSSVALSSDGSTAMIGAPNNEFCIGGAWVLVRSAGVWSQQALLRGTIEGTACDDGPDDGASDELEFGRAVALSADGNLGLVSRPFLDVLRPGGAWSYARVGSTWSGKLELRDRTGAKAGASSVAVSADGERVLLGKGEVGGSEAALAFVRSGSEWAQEDSALLPSDGAGSSSFGDSVALSSDGGTALLGGSSDNGSIGAAWVFGRPVLPPPTVVTGVASSVTDVSAELNGTVNPNGQEVFNCHFEYGTTTAYGFNVPCSALPGAGESPIAASASTQGLTANVTYHFRIVAANGGGVSYGADQTLTTLPDPPTVLTGTASSTQTSATLNGTVNPNSATVSDCHFDYGTSAAYGASAPCSSLPGSGTAPVAVSAAVAGLGENTIYHFRLVATNATGTSYGADRAFATGPVPPEYGRCIKVAKGTGLFETGGCTRAAGTRTYEWYPAFGGANPLGKARFTTKIKGLTEAKLLIAGKHVISCTGETGRGEYSGPRTIANVAITLTGCHLEALGSCQSLGAAVGEVVLSTLEGELGVIATSPEGPLKNKIGTDLRPASGEVVAAFACAGTPVLVTGSAIGEVPRNAMKLGTTLTFGASTKGVQKPARFEGAEEDVLLAKLGEAGAFEQTGLKLTMVQTNEEKVEVNSVY